MMNHLVSLLLHNVLVDFLLPIPDLVYTFLAFLPRDGMEKKKEKAVVDTGGGNHYYIHLKEDDSHAHIPSMPLLCSEVISPLYLYYYHIEELVHLLLLVLTMVTKEVLPVLETNDGMYDV